MAKMELGHKNPKAQLGLWPLLKHRHFKTDRSGLVMKVSTSNLVANRLNALGAAENMKIKSVDKSDTENRTTEVIRTIDLGIADLGAGNTEIGVANAINFMGAKGGYTEEFDFALFDMFGAIVCSGFFIPLQKGKTERIYLASSSDMLEAYSAYTDMPSIQAAGTNPHEAVSIVDKRKIRLAGLVCNVGKNELEYALINNLAAKLGILTFHLEFCTLRKQKAETSSAPTTSYTSVPPDKHQQRTMAQKISDYGMKMIPETLSLKDLENIWVKFGIIKNDCQAVVTVVKAA